MQNTFSVAESLDTSASRTFVGSSIRWVGTKWVDHICMNVSIDGGAPQMISEKGMTSTSKSSSRPSSRPANIKSFSHTLPEIWDSYVCP